jgi:hypothetical protein
MEHALIITPECAEQRLLENPGAPRIGHSPKRSISWHQRGQVSISVSRRPLAGLQPTRRRQLEPLASQSGHWQRAKTHPCGLQQYRVYVDRGFADVDLRQRLRARPLVYGSQQTSRSPLIEGTPRECSKSCKRYQHCNTVQIAIGPAKNFKALNLSSLRGVQHTEPKKWLPIRGQHGSK